MSTPLYTTLILSASKPSDSNRDFDGWLKARDPRSGIRDREAVDALAQAVGFHAAEVVAMPANNQMLLWRT